MLLQLPALRHLGLSYNKVESMLDFGEAAGPELRSVDIAYNCLTDISEVMSELQQVGNVPESLRCDSIQHLRSPVNVLSAVSVLAATLTIELCRS